MPENPYADTPGLLPQFALSTDPEIVEAIEARNKESQA